MKYHFVETAEKMNQGTYNVYDVIMDQSTSDVYHVPKEGGDPIFAFKATFLRQSKEGDVVFSVNDAIQTVVRLPVIGDKPVMRVRFQSQHRDPRPVIWPIKHPYWKTGSSSYFENGEERNACIIVAYVDSLEQVDAAWPEAEDVVMLEAGLTQYTFTSRFGFGDNDGFLLLGLETVNGKTFEQLADLAEVSHPGSVTRVKKNA